MLFCSLACETETNVGFFSTKIRNPKVIDFSFSKQQQFLIIISIQGRESFVVTIVNINFIIDQVMT